MPIRGWINPATNTYQARRWADRQRRNDDLVQAIVRGPTQTTPDPGTQTDSIRYDPLTPDVVFVSTSIFQPYGGSPLVLYPSSLVRPDPVNPGVAWLTVTVTGPFGT